MSATAPEEGTRRLVDRARGLLGANQYLTMATADEAGTPWATTVWYAAVPVAEATSFPTELVWLSRPEAQHSRNLEARPAVASSIFDSRQPAGTGAGLQLAGRGGRVPDERLDELVGVFSVASLAAGGSAWDRAKLVELGWPRLYVVRVEHAYLLEDGVRTEVALR